jgi:glycogen(starch) synthase
MIYKQGIMLEYDDYSSEEKKAATSAILKQNGKAFLFEIAWEVCQQVGGIYTVIRSKVPAMIDIWQKQYCLIGPYDPAVTPQEFEEKAPSRLLAPVIAAMQKDGYDVHYGHWLITGRPQVVMFNPQSAMPNLEKIKYFLWERSHISFTIADELMDKTLAFAFLVEQFFIKLSAELGDRYTLVAHFHEWLAAAAMENMQRAKLPVRTLFTTHATMLGRYLSIADAYAYTRLSSLDWQTEAKRYNILPQVYLERSAAHAADVFTTVSEVTARECQYLLGRTPDFILPNGLNIQRFVALHEFQNLHRTYKEKIHDFVMGHFFPSYTFDLDKTIYFFTSGRYEYRNKGFDLAIEALARLNHKLKQTQSKYTVVFFIISRQPCHSINPQVMHNRGVMEELRKCCEAITDQIDERLFRAVAAGPYPDLNKLVDEYWKLRLRRTMLVWKSKELPPIVTHNLVDDKNNEVLNYLRLCNLINLPEDPVKVVYHPDFIQPSNPLFGIDYDQFVRGCHLGIFPSRYEPWGYTPLECIALGVPTVTSDLSGFGSYVLKNIPLPEQKGMYVLSMRQASFHEQANQLTELLYEFLQMDRRDRIAQRNRVESSAEHFDWSNLIKHYVAAYEDVLAELPKPAGNHKKNHSRPNAT